MSDNKCAACGQWSGKGHHCPAPAATTVADRPDGIERSGYVPIDVGDRVNRANQAIEEQQKARQSALISRVREEVRQNGEGVAFEVERGGKPVGVVYTVREMYPDNPRDWFDNQSRIGMIRHEDQFGSLNELGWGTSRYDGFPDRVAGARAELEEEYPDAMIVPLRASSDIERVNIATPQENANNEVDGFAVIERSTLDRDFNGDRQIALDNFKKELGMYSDFASGNVWEIRYDASVPGEESHTLSEYGDPDGYVGEFLKDYTDRSNTLGTKLI